MVSSSTRAVLAGGESAQINVMDYVEIGTLVMLLILEI